MRFKKGRISVFFIIVMIKLYSPSEWWLQIAKNTYIDLGVIYFYWAIGGGQLTQQYATIASKSCIIVPHLTFSTCNIHLNAVGLAP